MPMFKTVLVANRGEIAARIMRTLRKMGIRSIAVHSDADRSNPHVELADVAVHLPGNSASETYLRGDLIIAADDARFADPVIRMGVAGVEYQAHAWEFGARKAKELLFTAEFVDAHEAQRLGMVNRVVPREYLQQVVGKYAETIASKSPLTLKIGKEAFYAQAEMGLSDAYDYASRVMVENMLARDAEEGIGAFIEKREPEWTGE